MAEVPLGRLLSNTAAEVRALAAMANRLDRVIGGLALDAQVAAAARGLQDADLLRQSLEELGGFLDVLGNETPIGISVETGVAFSRIRLRDLARRLEGDDGKTGPGPFPGETSEKSAGEVQLF